MFVSIECNQCGKVMNTNVSEVIKCILDCVDNKSIYSGFLCSECAEEVEDGFNENN